VQARDGRSFKVDRALVAPVIEDTLKHVSICGCLCHTGAVKHNGPCRCETGGKILAAPRTEMVHHRGELQIGPMIRLWCVCGFRWEGEGRRAAEAAWDEHIKKSSPIAVDMSDSGVP
jgi:hypothetical protein